jgi:hypothetical protein
VAVNYNLLAHWLKYGVYEGRSPYADGVMDPFVGG